MKTRVFSELREAVTPRAVGLILAVLALQFGFLGGCLGAFHHLTPHRVPIALVAPADVGAVLTQVLNDLPGRPLSVRPVADEGDARLAIDDRAVAGALIFAGTDGRDQLLVAGAGGTAVADALTSVVDGVEQAQGRSYTVHDIRPGDPLPYFLALGWMAGGCLAAIALCLSHGTRPVTRVRASVRLATLALYSAAAASGGVALASAMLGGLPADLERLGWYGGLLCFGTGALTLLLQTLFGFGGIGAAVALCTLIGAADAYPVELLSPIWRAVQPWLVPGVEPIRNLLYFGGVGFSRAAYVLGGYSLIASAGTFVVGALREPQPVVLADLIMARPAPTTPQLSAGPSTVSPLVDRHVGVHAR